MSPAGLRSFLRGSKYRAQPTVVGGVRFASKREARMFSELRLLERAGAIFCLCRQPRFPLRVNGLLICTYVADASYYERATGRFHVLDAKGFRTPVYELKRKLFLALYGLTVEER